MNWELLQMLLLGPKDPWWQVEQTHDGKWENIGVPHQRNYIARIVSRVESGNILRVAPPRDTNGNPLQVGQQYEQSGTEVTVVRIPSEKTNYVELSDGCCYLPWDIDGKLTHYHPTMGRGNQKSDKNIGCLNFII